jgi:hypothetical protein
MSWLEIWAMIQVFGIIIPFVIIATFIGYALIVDMIARHKRKKK